LLPDVQAELTVVNEIQIFAGYAPKIGELHSDEITEWPRSTSSSDKINAAFRLWMEREDLQEAVKSALDALEFPNGKEGASASMLTDEELADPFLSAPGLNGVKG
jgi:Arc/MetJ-type ribon-helix-helix transcriptional regulator